MTLFGNRSFADVSSQGSGDEIILDSGWAPNPMTGVLIRRGEDTQTQERRKVT